MLGQDYPWTSEHASSHGQNLLLLHNSQPSTQSCMAKIQMQALAAMSNQQHLKQDVFILFVNAHEHVGMCIITNPAHVCRTLSTLEHPARHSEARFWAPEDLWTWHDASNPGVQSLPICR